MKHKLILAFIGPSGVGKSTVIRQVLQDFPQFHYCKSVTTRPPRPDEDSYYFVTEEQFRGMLDRGELLEYIHTEHFYGTPLWELQSTDGPIVCDVTAEGLLKLKQLPDTTVFTIGLIPPDLLTLEQRILSRKDNMPPEHLRARMERAREEIQQVVELADDLVLNDDWRFTADHVHIIILWLLESYC